MSLVAVFQNEARFLKEWIEFNLLMGVEHFYLYNHLSTDNYYEVLKPYMDRGIVELTNITTKVKNKTAWFRLQQKIYQKAIRKVKNQTEWLAILDTDEFLYPIEGGKLSGFIV